MYRSRRQKKLRILLVGFLARTFIQIKKSKDEEITFILALFSLSLNKVHLPMLFKCFSLYVIFINLILYKPNYLQLVNLLKDIAFFDERW